MEGGDREGLADRRFGLQGCRILATETYFPSTCPKAVCGSKAVCEEISTQKIFCWMVAMHIGYRYVILSTPRHNALSLSALFSVGLFKQENVRNRGVNSSTLAFWKEVQPWLLEDLLLKMELSKVCGACKLEIGHGHYLSCMGIYWHPQCFCCSSCKHPICETEFTLLGTEPYHKLCYKELHHLKCATPANASPCLILVSQHLVARQPYCGLDPPLFLRRDSEEVRAEEMSTFDISIDLCLMSDDLYCSQKQRP
ncbi:hypothetical protein U9M48_028045 [Paspalum notatum var. saurae]|uniref:LIM zinc-binding domain-containing protein n=1 Tax=Paspalum notatum var. saurae TaxID=547442 RepID=A0AAQ3U0K9_PASNO